MPRVAVMTLVACCVALGQDTLPATNPAPRAESLPAAVKPLHPRVGVRVDTIALEKSGIARIEAVQKGSPAERAKLQIGDIIVSVDGTKVTDDKTYRELLARRQANDSVEFVIRRGSDEITTPITLFPWKVVEDEVVEVQHCLIKAKPAPGATRDPAEAKKLAEEILQKVKDGEDFGALVKQYSEDPGSKEKTIPGYYMLVQDGKQKPLPDAVHRKDFVGGFTALAWSLQVGDAAIVPYDKDLSPHGFHIIKRIK